MASIIETAKYILEKTGTMSTMKLQKLCYYSQAWTLAWDEVPLFNEDFEAWANGPVCRSLFDLHKGKFLISADDLPESSEAECLSDSERENINKVLEFYGDKEGHWLSELTHKERPWKEARQKANVLPGDSCNEIITKESIEDYYAGL